MSAVPDYPYYQGEPVELRWHDWAIVLAATALGFALLTHGPKGPISIIGMPAYSLVVSILFWALPLAALYWRARGHVGVLFNGWKWSYLWWGIAFGLLNLAFTAGIGLLAVNSMDLVQNNATRDAQGGSVAVLALFYGRTGIQLFGEELITILPFLFLLWLGTRKLGLSRNVAILIAWLGSALLFGALHLPTYGWNVPQALLLIGPVRLVLTLAYMKTKSIWTSTIAHVLNDWTMFTVAMVLRSMSAGTGG